MGHWIDIEAVPENKKIDVSVYVGHATIYIKITPHGFVRLGWRGTKLVRRPGFGVSLTPDSDQAHKGQALMAMAGAEAPYTEIIRLLRQEVNDWPVNVSHAGQKRMRKFINAHE